MQSSDLTRAAIEPFDVLPEIDAAIISKNIQIIYSLAPHVARLPAIERAEILTRIQDEFKAKFKAKLWNDVIRESSTVVAAPPDEYLPGWESLLKRRPDTKDGPGAPLAILANAITALREAPAFSGVLAHNDFTLSTVARKPPPWDGTAAGAEWTDHEDRLITNWLQHQGIHVSVEVASHAVQAVARDHRFHPVQEYLNGLTWDGVGRIDGWLGLYLGVEPTDYSNAVGARWLVSAAARIFRPGCKVDCCLILEGPQGSLKSTALKTLAGPWFTDDIAELGTKDASLQTAGVWLIELAELDSMSRGEISKIKAFMSRATDRFRPPYGRRIVTAPRQCIFAGSVNHSTYLRDETGGRRFWPVTCGCINAETLARDKGQLWAEAVVRFRSGAAWWLNTRELNQSAAEEQAARYEGDVWDPEIAYFVRLRDSVSISEVLGECLKKDLAQRSQIDANRVARSLKSIGWVRYHAGTRGGREWRYQKPGVPLLNGGPVVDQYVDQF